MARRGALCRLCERWRLVLRRIVVVRHGSGICVRRWLAPSGRASAAGAAEAGWCRLCPSAAGLRCCRLELRARASAASTALSLSRKFRDRVSTLRTRWEEISCVACVGVSWVASAYTLSPLVGSRPFPVASLANDVHHARHFDLKCGTLGVELFHRCHHLARRCLASLVLLGADGVWYPNCSPRTPLRDEVSGRATPRATAARHGDTR